MQHFLHGHRERGLVPQNDLGERVPDEQNGDTRTVEDLGGRKVVRGEHGEAMAFGLPGREVVDGGHGSRLPLKCTALPLIVRPCGRYGEGNCRTSSRSVASITTQAFRARPIPQETTPSKSPVFFSSRTVGNAGVNSSGPVYTSMGVSLDRSTPTAMNETCTNAFPSTSTGAPSPSVTS